MVFSSLIFLFLFLPLCVGIYYLVPGFRAKNAVLLIFSLLFYAWGEPVYILLMLALAMFNYGMGCAMGRFQNKKKLILTLAIIGDLAALSVFKYAGLLVETVNRIPGLSLPVPQIALPVGISFYTFQAMSYVVDLYRGRAQVQRSPFRFLLYVSMFPQLIAGPIVRYADIEKQLQHREHTSENAFYGLLRFSIGLGKKVLIADYAGQVATRLLDGQLSTATSVGMWLGLLMFAFQIYFDFSGYSDMAIGLGHMFGFKYRENFDLPYISRSITEFWRRWHISLGSFFRDYVYIPMGGNRRHRTFNLLVTWALTGLWHGASWNFLLWGLYFFLLLAVEKLLWKPLQKLPGFLRIVGTMFCVLMGWALFYYTDVSALWQTIQVLFGAAGAGFVNEPARIQLLNALPLLLVCIIGASPLPRLVGEGLGLLCAGKEQGSVRQKLYALLIFLFCGAVLTASVVSLVGSSFSPFLYYRF